MPDEGSESRLRDPLAYERGFWSRGLSRVAGLDEVGRGPLAGPVVAAAVVLPPDVRIEGVTDSKALTREAREALDPRIREAALAVGLGAASAREIDRVNILTATRFAMERALARLRIEPDHVVIDGLPMRSWERPHDAVVEGDRIVHSIACASVVAKVCRDRVMRRLDARYPGYGWASNVGYATAEHRAAIDELGPTPHHRLTFGILQLSLPL